MCSVGRPSAGEDRRRVVVRSCSSARPGCPASCPERAASDAPGLPAKDACPTHRRGAEAGPILPRCVSRLGKRRQAALSPPMRRRSVGTTERKSNRTFENAPNALPASDTRRGLCDKSGPDAVLSGFRKRMRRYSGPETEGFGDRVRRLSRRTARLAVGDLLPSFASTLFCPRSLAAVRCRPLRGRCPSPPIAGEGPIWEGARAADGRLFSRVGVGGRDGTCDRYFEGCHPVLVGGVPVLFFMFYGKTGGDLRRSGAARGTEAPEATAVAKKKTSAMKRRFHRVDPPGLEPRKAEPESAVLPLHHGSMSHGTNVIKKIFSTKNLR